MVSIIVDKRFEDLIWNLKINGSNLRSCMTWLFPHIIMCERCVSWCDYFLFTAPNGDRVFLKLGLLTIWNETICRFIFFTLDMDMKKIILVEIGFFLIINCLNRINILIFIYLLKHRHLMPCKQQIHPSWKPSWHFAWTILPNVFKHKLLQPPSSQFRNLSRYSLHRGCGFCTLTFDVIAITDENFKAIIILNPIII